MKFLFGWLIFGLLFSPTTIAAPLTKPAPVVANVVNSVVLPAYSQLVLAAKKQSEVFSAFCMSPSLEALASSRSAFAVLVDAFSRVEMYRFGPARADNRFEKLFFWPDRRGRGLRQVRRVINEADESAIEPKRLKEKSVAVQGVLALDFILFGDNNEILLSKSNIHRCRFGQAVAKTILFNAQTILEDWKAPGGYADQMINAHSKAETYRSHNESLQELLRAAREQMEIVTTIKMVALVGTKEKTAKPRTLPFWRSGLALKAIIANIESVQKLLEAGKLSSLLPDRETGLLDEFNFEVSTVFRTLKEQSEPIINFEEFAESPKVVDEIRRILPSLNGAKTIVSDRLPQALGLARGFNSLDGD